MLRHLDAARTQGPICNGLATAKMPPFSEALNQMPPHHEQFCLDWGEVSVSFKW